ncbi:MAG TPA: AAA family ATPase [Pyrinomonadaceae bacterium]|jgi:hypothetical protein|nr:AAA family ATPase [Pyrinomonadaceae bacterium]
MDTNGLETILKATDGQIRLLERKLSPGSAYSFMLRGGPGFSPSEFEVFIRRSNGSFQLRAADEFDYRGRDPLLRDFAARGWHDEPTLDELIYFIRASFAPNGRGEPGRDAGEARGPRYEPLAPPSSVTDLKEAGRRLRSAAARKRILLDPAAIRDGLKARIYGQDECVNMIAENVALEFAKVRREKPVSFFFFGPSGVGKTETALTLAHLLDLPEHGLRYEVVRFNMNEYQERHSAYRFVGAPPSYTGYGDTPLLFRAIQNNPHLIILLDEIEKAHPDIFKTLMALVDTGELTFSGGEGSPTGGDFRQCIIIFTSNVRYKEGLELRARLADMNSAEFQIRAREILVCEGVPPEIVGRIGSLVMFGELSGDDLLAIVTDKVQRCGSDYGLTVTRIAPSLLAHITAAANSSKFGVRVVEQVVERMIAPKLLEVLNRAPDTVGMEVGYEDDAVVVVPSEPSDVL